MFLVGPYLEMGEFYSVRSRPGPRRSGAARQKSQHENKKKSNHSNRSPAMETVAQAVKNTATNVTSDAKSTIARTIDLAFERIAAECAYQREV